jgi:C4-dicarboxylate-specific signal transduction histidine kinase
MNDAHDSADGLREVCHDIRQPIAAVLALAGAALTTNPPEDTRHLLRQIVGLAEWQSEVIESWLEASARGSPPGAGHADVVRIVSDVMAAERLTWPGNLTLVWPSEPLFTRLQPVTLRRMAANLLANATRAAGPDGAVTIEVARHDGRILLMVEDDGPGFGWLPPGWGLGLCAAARQAAQHEGRLECGRGRLGGARVSLWLPWAARPAEPLVPPRPACPARGRPADATCAV